MHCRWPKFQNIHRLVADGDFDETKPVLALEKLDGSNLGLEIHPNAGLVVLHGRNSVLWHSRKKAADPFDRTYGNVREKLHPIAPIIPKLTTLAVKLIKEDECDAQPETIVFFGEWYMGEAVPSWHPFGYGFRATTTGKNNFRTMTSARYAMFLEHGLEPPPMLFSGGTICEAIDALYPTMKCNPANLEGVFITSEAGGSRNAAKWKSGNFEEQTSFVIPADMELSEAMSEAVPKLRAVFDTKIERVATKPTKAKKAKAAKPTEEEEEVDRQILLALHSVLSKSHVTPEELRSLDRQALSVELKRINAEVVEDVLSTYDASNMELSGEKRELVKKRIGRLVGTQIMKPQSSDIANL